MVVASTIWLNMFPPIDRISMTIIPRKIVTELQVKYKDIAILSLDNIFKHTKKMTM